MNKFFASGLQAYKAASTNQPEELVQLNSLGHVSGAILGTQLRLEGGFASLSDNQVDSLDIKNYADDSSLLRIGVLGITSGKKISYAQAPVLTGGLDVPHKAYTDAAI